MTREVDVTYNGIDFTVKGNWEQGYSETRWEPGVSSGFDDCSIYLGSDDLTELLDEGVVESIINDATETLIQYDNDRKHGRFETGDYD